MNNKRLQEARFQELVATYRNTVLSADQDVENGLVTFLRAQQRAKSQAASVADRQEGGGHRVGPIRGRARPT